jgi:NAD(P)-dependent dehydrogenase (short-subunit alcohol dehydrogenase family)
VQLLLHTIMKKILITGTSSGFGLDASKYLAEKGHHVYASMRNVDTKNADAANELRSYAKDHNFNIEVLELDVTNDASIKNAVANIDDLDVLINNAGSGYGGPVEAFDGQQVLGQLDLNVVGPIRVANAVLPIFRKKNDGLIIQVSSTAGRAAFPGFGVYHASKWGLEGMSEALRYELAPLGIDVTIVEPGPFATNFFSNMIAPSDAETAAAYEHVGQFGQGFQQQVMSLFEDENAPTDPMIVVHDFEKLINMAKGTRPLRTISGLDFGFQAINDATEPIRKAGLEGMGISEWDGPKV